MKNKFKIILFVILTINFWVNATYIAHANDIPQIENLTFDDKETYFRAVEALTDVPWYVLAAYYQYELNTQKKVNNQTSIRSHLEMWSGITNSSVLSTNNLMYNVFFNGIGRDGNGDNISDKNNFYDNIYSFAIWLSQSSQANNLQSNYMNIISNLYNNEKAVFRIIQFAAIYKHFDTFNVSGNVFPIPLNYSYSYKNTWGAGRSFGGYRIHEGTDIFAKTWTPVKSTTNGIVEIKGWNKYGGWRIGIRDLNNVYHYYAHLAGYAKNITIGDIVEAGQIIGYVGSSGYGVEGTTGKFPPHLHYGMYKDTGKNEWAFDPTASLRRWEQLEKNMKR